MKKKEVIVHPLVKRDKGIVSFECDLCHKPLKLIPEETEAPIWATYSCTCGTWVQYGAWNGRNNLWEYKGKYD